LWLIVALGVAEFLNCYSLKALIKGYTLINLKSLVLVLVWLNYNFRLGVASSVETYLRNQLTLQILKEIVKTLIYAKKILLLYTLLMSALSKCVTSTLVQVPQINIYNQ